jgi:hypothetical protein
MLRVICTIVYKILFLIFLLFFALYGVICVFNIPDTHICKNDAKGKYAQWYLRFNGEI